MNVENTSTNYVINASVICKQKVGPHGLIIPFDIQIRCFPRDINGCVVPRQKFCLKRDDDT